MIVDLIYLMGRLPDNTAVWGDIYYLINVKTSSDAGLPILLNSAFTDLKKERLP